MLMLENPLLFESAVTHPLPWFKHIFSVWLTWFIQFQAHNCRERVESVVCATVLRGGGSQLLLKWLIVKERSTELSGLTFSQVLCHHCTFAVMLWLLVGSL